MDTAVLLKQLDAAADLKEQQKILETLSQGLGINQYWRNTEKAQEAGRESNTRYGSQLLSHAVTSVAEGVIKFLEKAKQGGGGRRHLAARYLSKVDPHVVAFLGLKAAIDSISTKKSLQKVAIEIGTYMVEIKHGYQTLNNFLSQNPPIGTPKNTVKVTIEAEIDSMRGLHDGVGQWFSMKINKLEINE